MQCKAGPALPHCLPCAVCMYACIGLCVSRYGLLFHDQVAVPMNSWTEIRIGPFIFLLPCHAMPCLSDTLVSSVKLDGDWISFLILTTTPYEREQRSASILLLL